ncbi:hypothetical protein Tco_1555558 [Tanacetum coccineum]
MTTFKRDYNTIISSMSTYVSYELYCVMQEIIAEENATYAKNRMAELQVLLEQEKADMETNRAHTEQKNVPMESHNAKTDEEQNALDENELQIEGNVEHINSCWESLGEQIKQGKEKIDDIVFVFLANCPASSFLCDHNAIVNHLLVQLGMIGHGIGKVVLFHRVFPLRCMIEIGKQESIKMISSLVANGGTNIEALKKRSHVMTNQNSKNYYTLILTAGPSYLTLSPYYYYPPAQQPFHYPSGFIYSLAQLNPLIVSPNQPLPQVARVATVYQAQPASIAGQPVVHIGAPGPTVIPGQETTLPHSFSVMTLQDPASCA